MAAAPIFIGTPKLGVGKIENADGTTKKTIVTAGGSGYRCEAIFGTSTDTAQDIIVQLYYTTNSVDFVLGCFTIPAANAALPLQTVSWLRETPFATADPTLVLPPASSIKASVSVSVGSGFEVAIFVAGGDF